jgi:hypothetical protein
VGLTVDPTLTRADRLVGQVLGQIGELPNVYSELEINFFLLRRLLGVRSKEGEKGSKVCGGPPRAHDALPAPVGLVRQRRGIYM